MGRIIEVSLPYNWDTGQPGIYQNNQSWNITSFRKYFYGEYSQEKTATTTDKRKFPLTTKTDTNEHWKNTQTVGGQDNFVAIMEDGNKHLATYLLTL